MRKIFCVVLSLCLLMGCAAEEPVQKPQERYITGVWISFLELDKMLASNSFKSEFEKAVKNSKARGVTDMFVCVRPYCDAYYQSSLFPLRDTAQNQNFDILAFMVDACHKNDIKFHAWVNPYRVRTSDEDIEALPDSSPAKKWLKDSDIANDDNVLFCSGIYLNPASSEVRQLVTDGVREVIDNYPIDGVHFDDYFYPTTAESLDSASYAKYTGSADSPLTLGEWRRANVNALISGVYTAIKFKNKNIAFSVSPSASIEDNLNKYYADVAAWIESGCVDYIIPQLYFGSNYPQEQYRFENLLPDWQALIKNSAVRLLIGLAAYKINTTSELERAEWANGANVIKTQAELCKKNEGVSGHIYFSYSSMVEYIK